MATIHDLYNYTVRLTVDALNQMRRHDYGENGSQKDASSIVDHNIFRYGFTPPYELSPQKSEWDLLRLFLINAVNGDGNPWIKFPSGAKGYRRAAVAHVDGALRDFSQMHSESPERAKVDRFRHIISGKNPRQAGVPESLALLMEEPSLDNNIRGCSWITHAKAAIDFLDKTQWIEPERLCLFMDRQSLGNSVSTLQFNENDAWDILVRFSRGNWKSIFGWDFKVPHVGLEKAANFFADAGFLNIAKPDVQMRKTYQSAAPGAKISSKEAFFTHYKLTRELFRENQSKPIFEKVQFKARHLDRMVWLIGSGRMVDDEVSAPGTNDDRRRQAHSILFD